MSRCSCGRMDTPRGMDLCSACEQDYIEEQEQQRADEDRQYRAYCEALEPKPPWEEAPF